MTEKEILIRWNDFEQSEFAKNMQTGFDYFNCKNEITEKNKGRYGTDEKNIEYQTLTTLSDRKIANNFFKFIINQQVAYGVARKFILTKNNVEVNEKELNLVESIKSKLFRFFNKGRDEKRFEKFNLLVSKTFSENYAEFVNSCVNAPKAQIGWLYIYYNDNAELEFMSMNPQELCPIWGNDKKTYVDGMIRKYQKTEYDDEGAKQVTYIEYYDLERIRVYKYAEVDTEPLEFIEEHPYYVNQDGSLGRFNRVPFIPIKYNADMTYLLQDIKPQVDAYDKIMSEVANNIIDLPNSILLIKGLDGSNPNEVSDFVKNLRQTRLMFAPAEGDGKNLSIEQNIQQIDIALTRLRKDIFELGGGVDTQNKDLKDTSGVALRWSYSNLEEKFNVWSNQIDIAIKSIIDFIIWDNVAQGGEDFSDIDYDIVYDTDSIINESETIQNLQLSKGMISPETIAANHPYTKNTQKELEGMKEQMKYEAEMKLLAKGGNESGTNDHNTNEGITGVSQ